MFAEPFDLLKLPKISGNTSYNVPLVCSDDHLFLGVSGSSISKLTVVPPQVLSAHSVAPGTIITAILADDASLRAYATSERGKFHLNILSAQDENSNKVAISKEVDEEICAMYLSADKSKVATVGKHTSLVHSYSVNDLSKVSTGKGVEHGATVYSCPLIDETINETLFTQLCLVKSGVSLRIHVLDGKGVRCLHTTSLEGPNHISSDKTHWSSYESSLYAVSSGIVSIYHVPDGSLVNSFELESTEPVTAAIALPHNNLAISRPNFIDLVDCTYQSKVSKTQLAGKNDIKLLSYSDYYSTLIALSSNEQLIGISVTPTSGMVLESIGNGSAQKLHTYVLTDIFGGFHNQTEDQKIQAEQSLNSTKDEVSSCIKDIESAIKSKDGPGFSRIVTYLKNPQLNWLRDQDEIVSPSEQDLVFEESDRVADTELIRTVCKLAFIPRFKPYLPIGVALYLLTHPLFPVTDPAFRKMLRNLERSDSMLYRQALVSLTGLTVEDLVTGLLSKDEATFIDAAMRIQEDFGSQQILTGVRKAFSGIQSVSSLSVLIERLSRFPETIGLIGPFIDAIGLLAWDANHINDLKSRINENIASVESCSVTDSAITELFDSIGVDPSSGTIPSAGELQARSQKKLANDSKNTIVAKYSVETLVL